MLEPVEELFSLPTITSDCRPWTDGRSVKVCSGCGVMKRVTRRNFDSIYDDYKNYPESEGKTKKILDFIVDKIPVPESVLDIGCGDGTGIAVMQNQYPLAKVMGYEPKICTERPTAKFDLVTLFQVLEHVEDIHEILSYIKSILTNDGHVLIQVPYTAMWPFDLIIADHVWHFTMDSLIRLFDKMGFAIIYVGSGVFLKELTLVAKLGKSLNPTSIEESPQVSIDWLLRFKSFLDDINEKVAIYGTSPAAAWIGNILGSKVAYYLDDDRVRYSKPFNGRHVYPPIFCQYAVVPSFADCDLSAIKAKNPELKFLW